MGQGDERSSWDKIGTFHGWKEGLEDLVTPRPADDSPLEIRKRFFRVDVRADSGGGERTRYVCSLPREHL